MKKIFAWDYHFGKPEQIKIFDILLIFFFVSKRFPFNWKSFPIGYLVAVCFEFFGAIVLFGLVASLTIFFVGICMFLLAITKDIKQELEIFNEIDENNVDEKELEEKFCEIIQLHSDAIHLSINNNFFDFFYFGWNSLRQ